MILLTGATGFLGSRLLERLLEDGREVVAIKRRTSNISRIAPLLQHRNLVIVEVESEGLEMLFSQFRIRTIVHTATEYGRNSTPISKILDANLILPIRLAELAISRGACNFVNTDSYFN